MKKGYLIVLGVLLLLTFYSCSKYNQLVGADENLKNAWGDVQADYQRRADLIPSLIATVKKAAENEKDILTTVTNARAGIPNLEKEASENSEQIKSAKSPQELEAVGQRINSAIKITLEAYPFIGLQGQLEGTENRIKTSRSDYNKKVKEYNIAARTFPNNIFAKLFGFSVKEEFKASEGSDKAPDVKALFE